MSKLSHREAESYSSSYEVNGKCLLLRQAIAAAVEATLLSLQRWCPLGRNIHLSHSCSTALVLAHRIHSIVFSDRTCKTKYNRFLDLFIPVLPPLVPLQSPVSRVRLFCHEAHEAPVLVHQSCIFFTEVSITQLDHD